LWTLVASSSLAEIGSAEPNVASRAEKGKLPAPEDNPLERFFRRTFAYLCKKRPCKKIT
jgi:hypothetical protein